MNNRKALKEAINLGDTVALHALADLLEEENDPLAKSMRFIVWAKYYHSNYEAYIALAQALTGFDTDKEGWK